jgi:polysaccharide biosynthesis/export protein
MSLKVFYILSLAIFWGEQIAVSQDVPSSPVKNMAAESAISPGLSQTSTRSAPDAPESVIGSGDLLKVSVFGVNTFDEEVRVSGKGSISLPLIGDVHVAGLTTDQAQSLIQEKLIDGNFMVHPEVSVLEKEYATQGVAVLGEVQKPGVYPLLGPHHLFDVLSLAGGMTPKAGSEVTITHRDHPNQPQIVALAGDVAKSTAANVEILPGDTVAVSLAGIVYVVGDVKNPAGVVMPNGSEMTVVKAIAMAGGANPSAALNGGKIIRRTAQGPQEIPIQLKQILSAKAADPKLQPDDIVFVPTSAAKSAAKRGLEAIVQTAVGVAIYHPAY